MIRPRRLATLARAACLGLLFWGTNATPAWAQPGGAASATESDKQKAREHFRRGERLYNVSDYTAALAEFKAGYLLHDDPVFLFNIAQCHRMLGARDEAITFYERYLRAYPEAVNRAEVERRLEQLRREREAAPAASQAGAPAPVAPPAASAAPPPRVPEVRGPAPAAPPPAVLAGEAPPPLHARWWFWAGLGALAAGTVAVVALSSGAPAPDCAGVSPCFTVDPRR